MKIVRKKTWVDEIPEIDAGSYVGKFTGLEEREITVRTPNGEVNRKVFVWSFEVDGQIISGITSTNVSKRSKAYKWFKALVGEDFDEIDTEQLVGKEAIVTVAKKKIAGLEVPRIVDVAPKPKESKPASVQKKTK